MRIVRSLQPQTMAAAGGNTGGNLKISDFDSDILPVAEAVGGTAYLRKLMLRLQGTLTFSMASGTINVSRLISNILLEVTGIQPALFNAPGNSFIRRYRIRNRGLVPPGVGSNGTTTCNNPTLPFTTGLSAMGAGTINIDISFPLEFALSMGKKSRDGELPLAMFAKSKFLVTMGQLADVNASLTAFALTLTAVGEFMIRKRARLPGLPVFIRQDLTANQQPTIDEVDGRVLSAFLQPSADGLFLSGTDWALVGSTQGGKVTTRDSEPVSTLYLLHNLETDTDIEDHTATRTDLSAYLPFQWAESDRNGQSLEEGYEGMAGWRYRAGAAPANPYSLCRDFFMHNGDWRNVIAKAMGVDPDAQTETTAPEADPTLQADVPQNIV